MLPLAFSVFLHALAIFLLTYDFSPARKSEVVSVPMFVVDLTQVKVAEITNLPPKLVKTEASKPTKKSVRTSAYSKASTANVQSASRQNTPSGGKGGARDPAHPA